MLKDFDKVKTDGFRVVSNFHTHNYLCKHAVGDVCDYVKEGVAHGYRSIGISDHFVSHGDNEPPYISWRNLESEYLPQFEVAKAEYGDKIKIYKGVEVAYFEGNDSHYRPLRDKLDYVILGQHGYEMGGVWYNSFFDGLDEENVVAYCKHAIKSLKTGIFDIFAHPDLIFINQPPLTQKMTEAFDEMIRVAVECGVIVELNANGIRNAKFKYPTQLLADKCLKYNAKTIVSSDCHKPEELYDEYVLKLYAYAKRIGLNVLDDIF